ncbi:MAG: hypothetical protein ABSA54_07585 [Terriglobales bacterium]|jgi:hypothetical protein
MKFKKTLTGVLSLILVVSSIAAGKAFDIATLDEMMALLARADGREVAI